MPIGQDALIGVMSDGLLERILALAANWLNAFPYPPRRPGGADRRVDACLAATIGQGAVRRDGAVSVRQRSLLTGRYARVAA